MGGSSSKATPTNQQTANVTEDKKTSNKPKKQTGSKPSKAVNFDERDMVESYIKSFQRGKNILTYEFKTDVYNRWSDALRNLQNEAKNAYRSVGKHLNRHDDVKNGHSGKPLDATEVKELKDIVPPYFRKYMKSPEYTNFNEFFSETFFAVYKVRVEKFINTNIPISKQELLSNPKNKGAKTVINDIEHAIEELEEHRKLLKENLGTFNKTRVVRFKEQVKKILVDYPKKKEKRQYCQECRSRMEWVRMYQRDQLKKLGFPTERKGSQYPGYKCDECGDNFHFKDTPNYPFLVCSNTNKFECDGTQFCPKCSKELDPREKARKEKESAFMKELDSLIAIIDTNDNDYIDFQEFFQTFPDQKRSFFQGIDLDNDNKLTRDEFKKYFGNDIMKVKQVKQDLLDTQNSEVKANKEDVNTAQADEN